jgi:hypothetical protein
MAAADGGAWYEVVEGDDLLQGDSLDHCPVLLPPEADKLKAALPEGAEAAARTVVGTVVEYDVIVVSHSCDLLQDKSNSVLVSPLFTLDEIAEAEPNFAHKKMKEHMRQGHNPGYHMLAACSIAGADRSMRVADFHTVFSLPVLFVKQIAVANGSRLRLQSPYREDFSQAFARFFMRVALPVEIPEF